MTQTESVERIGRVVRRVAAWALATPLLVFLYLAIYWPMAAGIHLAIQFIWSNRRRIGAYRSGVLVATVLVANWLPPALTPAAPFQTWDVVEMPSYLPLPVGG